MATTAPMFLELDREERERELDESFQQLNNSNADINEESKLKEHNRKGKRILLAAEKNSLFNLVKYLSEDPNLINYADSDGYTPLHRASYGGNLDSAKYLIRHGANIEARTSDDWTPLHCAVRWNNLEVAEYLLNQGADVNAKSSGSNTPLHIVASNGRHSLTCDIIQMLLYHPNCDFTIKNQSGDTAYDLARRSGPFYRFWVGVTTLYLDESKP